MEGKQLSMSGNLQEGRYRARSTQTDYLCLDMYIPGQVKTACFPEPAESPNIRHPPLKRQTVNQEKKSFQQ